MSEKTTCARSDASRAYDAWKDEPIVKIAMAALPKNGRELVSFEIMLEHAFKSGFVAGQQDLLHEHLHHTLRKAASCDLSY